MKNLILCCIATVVLVSVVSCSDTGSQTASTTTTQSAPLQTDTKEIHH